MTEPTSPHHALEVRDLGIGFAGQVALQDVSFSIPQGSITALLGMNGSGKSTTIKILSGFYRADRGSISIHGSDLSLPVDPAEVHRQGLRFLHQDLGLVEEMSVADNFALAHGYGAGGPLRFIRDSELRQRVGQTLGEFGIDVDPATPIRHLDRTSRTMVAIARAFFGHEDHSSYRGMILVLDEPTASLPAEEVGVVLETLEDVRRRGGSVVYVSHRLDEVLRIADRLVVLRDGRLQAEQEIGDLDAEGIVRLVVGEELSAAPAGRAARSIGSELLSVREVSGPKVVDASFAVRESEIVGITGLVGCGRSELLRIIAGAQQRRRGHLSLDGAEYDPTSAYVALRRGVAFAPQDRRTLGCVPLMSLEENLTLGHLHTFMKRGWLRLRAVRRKGRELIGRYDIRPPRLEQPVRHMSGGNQQKAVLAKALLHEPRLLVLDEPTQGIDVGAKAEIATIIRDVAARGAGVLVGSSDIEELVVLCDRVIVLDRGRIVAEAEGADLTQERLTYLSVRQGMRG